MSQKNVKPNSRLDTVTAHDTFQRLSYDSRIPFDALWEKRDAVSIKTTPQDRRKYLKDTLLEEAIKQRPRVYMSPSISLDDVKDSSARETLVNFTYMTTANRSSKEVWKDFHPRSPCLATDVPKKEHKSISTQSIFYVPPGLGKVALKWDAQQERNIIAEEMLEFKNSVCQDTRNPENNLTEVKEEEEIKRLIAEGRLSILYNKFPSSYGGFRSHMALGVPLEREKLDFGHPNLPISKAISQYHEYMARGD